MHRVTSEGVWYENENDGFSWLSRFFFCLFFSTSERKGLAVLPFELILKI